MELFHSSLGISKESGSYIVSNALLLSENANTHQVFRKEKVKSVAEYIKKLNVFFGKVGTRRQALSHLLVLLPQCSETSLVDNGTYWIKICSQSLRTEDKEMIVAALTVIRIILRRCHANKELFNQVVKCNTEFLTPVYSLDLEFVEDSCDCLFEYLRHFQNKGLAIKTQIEALIFSTLGLPLGASTSRKIRSAGRLYAVVPLPGGAAKEAEAQARGSQLRQLIALAHSAFDVLFANVNEIEGYDFPRDHKLPVTMLESAVALNEPIRTLLTASTLVSHVFDFVGAFVETVSTIKINPKHLLRLALRALQVEPENFSGTFIESKTAAFILPSVHLRALRLLKDLVNNNVCGVFLSHVEEQAKSSLKSSLQKTSKSSGESDRTYRVKNSAASILCYQILSDIVKIGKGCHKDTIEAVVPVIMKDIVPVRDSVLLNSAIRGGRLSLINAKKKSKKKGYTVTPNNGDGGTTQDQMISESVNVTVAALNLAQTIFLHASHVMSHKVVSSLSKELIALLQNRRLGAYARPEVRASFLSAVSAYALYPHPLCPPSYAFLYAAFQEWSRDSDPVVSGICEKTLSVLTFVTANPNLTSLSDAVRLSTTTQTEPVTHNTGSSFEQEELCQAEENGKHSESENSDIDESEMSLENDIQRESEDDQHEVLTDQDSNETNSEEINKSNDYDHFPKGNERSLLVANSDSDENDDAEKENENMSECESVNEIITGMQTDSENDSNADSEVITVSDNEPSLKGNNKRKSLKNKAAVSPNKKLKGEHEVTEAEPALPHLSEMLSSFVDADPDPF